MLEIRFIFKSRICNFLSLTNWLLWIQKTSTCGNIYISYNQYGHNFCSLDLESNRAKNGFLGFSLIYADVCCNKRRNLKSIKRLNGKYWRQLRRLKSERLWITFVSLLLRDINHKNQSLWIRYQIELESEAEAQIEFNSLSRNPFANPFLCRNIFYSFFFVDVKAPW